MVPRDYDYGPSSVNPSDDIANLLTSSLAIAATRNDETLRAYQISYIIATTS